MKAKKKLVHLLITVDLTPEVRMHSYVICPKERERAVMEGVIDTMFKKAEKMGVTPWPAIVLCTKLGTGVAIVRGVLSEKYPESIPKYDEVKDFHCTVWAMAASHPADKKLMELH